MFCSNHDQGCKATLKLEELKSHLSLSNASGCGYVSILCPNKCSQSVFCGEMDLHLKKCTKRIEACTHCKTKMTYDSLNGHYLVCKEMNIACPRKCGKSLRRHALKDHEDTCPNMPVKCPFYDAGCNEDLMRKELDEHVEKTSNAHLMKVMASYSQLKADHDALKIDHDTLEADVDHDAVKKEFADFKSQAAIEVTRMKEVVYKAHFDITGMYGVSIARLPAQ